MIINNKTGNEVVVDGESHVKKATISEEKLEKLQYILTKGLYTDPISAVIVEITNNGIDGVVQAGKSPVDNPVLVEIGTYRNGGHFFRVSDTGIGLDKDGFENILMCYLTSTKEKDGESIGFFGLGGKSFLALDRAATFTCRKEGMEYKYLAYEGAQFCEYDLLYEKETTEENGVVFEVEIKDSWEKRDFIDKAKNKLSYYDTAVLIIDGVIHENKIFRQEDFQWSDSCTEGEMHLCLKDVLYTIDWAKLGIPRIDVPVALTFGLSDGIIVTPSREGIILTEAVKEIIKKKICDVADWFVEKYNETIVEFDNFVTAFPHLGNNNKYLELENRKFYLDGLAKYSSYQLEDVKVKGLTNPRYYFIHLDRLCSNFHVIGKLGWRGKYETKHLSNQFKQMMMYNYKAVLLDQHPIGRVKDFIKQKYANDTYFLLEIKPNLDCYKRALRLDTIQKQDWRKLIVELQEFHRQIKEGYIIGLFDIRESAEFLKFEEEQKAIAKANKAAGINDGYKVLDKQEGEVTIAYSRDPLIGDVPVFEKNTYVIKDLPKSKHITLLFNEEDKEEAKNYHNLHKNLKVAIIGKRERTKLPDIHQIMEKEKFEKTKLFKRIATAMRIENVLNRWNAITQYQEDVVEECLEKVAELKRELDVYKAENYTRMNLGREARESFMALAHEHSLWDNEILYKVKELEKALETFYFLQYIEYPRYGTEDDKSRVKKIINQLLIYQKKHGHLDNYELTEKPLPVEQLEEQKELEEEFLNTPEAEMCLA